MDVLGRTPEYFILNNAQFLAIAAEEAAAGKEREKERGRPHATYAPGIFFSTLDRHDFRHAWHSLPE